MWNNGQIETARDLNILTIQSVYRITTTNWARPNPFARQTNGLVLIVDGSIRYNFAEKAEVAVAGDILKFPQGLVYSGVKITDKNSFYVIDFETLGVSELDSFPLPTVFHTRSFKRVEGEFKMLLDFWHSPLKTSKLMCKSKLYEILSILLSEYLNGFSAFPGIVYHIAEYINKNFHNPELSVNGISEFFHVSESQIRKLFVKYIHQSPIKYIQSIRISHAKKMLSDNISVQDTAMNCGYSSLYYFSRIFKKVTGYTPSEFKILC